MKCHTYQRGDPVVVYDRDQWRDGTVVDANGIYSVVVHIKGYDSALRLRADDTGLKPAETRIIDFDSIGESENE